MTTFDALLSALAGAPVLPGARCRGRHHLFDPKGTDEPAEVAEARHAQALALCNRCPALTACAAWVDSLPARQKPYGVTAGQVRNEPQPGRPIEHRRSTPA